MITLRETDPVNRRPALPTCGRPPRRRLGAVRAAVTPA